MPDLRAALDCAVDATYSIEAGEKERALGQLAKGSVPASRAFTAGSREAFALAIVYGAILEEAA